MLNQFKVFLVVAQTKSLSKAAKILHLSQPAVSSKIQSMEDFLGVKLFTRTAHGVTLTEAGKIAVDYSTRFMDLEQAMTDEINQLLNSNPQLVIGSSCTSGNYALPGCISNFKETNPQANIKLDISNSMETMNKLNRGEIDLAIIDGKVETSHAVHVLDSIDLVFVVANSGKFRKSKLSLKEIKTKPFIVREKGAAVRTIMERLAADNNCTINDFNVISEMNSLHSIKAAILSGTGVTLLPLIAVKKEIEAGNLRIIQVDDLSLRIDVNLVYPLNVESTPIAQKFVQHITRKHGFCWEQ